jgi:diguanylate cyclase (GGDEF)-like protein
VFKTRILLTGYCMPLSLRTIRNPLVLLLSAMFVVALFSLPVINYLAHRNDMLTEVQSRELPLTADNIYSALQRDIIRPKLIAELMASDPLLINWLESDQTTKQPIFAMLNQRLTESGANTTFLVSEKTRRYYHNSDKSLPIIETNPHDLWYFNFIQSDKIFQANIDKDLLDDNKTVAYINYKIFDENKKLLGATGIGLDINYLQEILRQYQKDFDANVYLVSVDGRINLSQTYIGKNGENILSIAEYSEVAKQAFDQKNHFFTLTHGDDTYALQTRFIPELNAYVFAERNIDKLLRSAKDTLISNLIICSLITLISLPLILTTLRRYQKTLELAANTDSLTSLLNRHAFMPIIEQAIEEARRDTQPLCILFIDVDFFKKVNDQHGHLFGDATLVQLANLLSNNFRNSDAVCRWGGEEFSVLLKQTDVITAGNIANKVRENVAKTPITYNNKTLNITISIGIAEYITDENCNAWLERSDKALYAAKNNGRNRVQLAD